MHNFRAGIRCLREGIEHARLRYWFVRNYERLSRERDAAFALYKNHSPRGLHIGAAYFALENWFNTDLEPDKEGVYYLDATQPLPFPDHCFDFVFSEHLIEHIPFAAGLQLLKECRRVLKPAGLVRTATPNLKTVVALMSDHDPDAERYLNFAVEAFRLPTEPFPKAAMVINNAFRGWGHQFLYDPETLRQAMKQAGFRDIVQQRPGESTHPQLRGLEQHGRDFEEWVNQYETMVFEGSVA